MQLFQLFEWTNLSSYFSLIFLFKQNQCSDVSACIGWCCLRLYYIQNWKRFFLISCTFSFCSLIFFTHYYYYCQNDFFLSFVCFFFIFIIIVIILNSLSPSSECTMLVSSYTLFVSWCFFFLSFFFFFFSFLLSFFHSSLDIRFGHSFVQFHKVLFSVRTTFSQCITHFAFLVCKLLFDGQRISFRCFVFCNFFPLDIVVVGLLVFFIICIRSCCQRSLMMITIIIFHLKCIQTMQWMMTTWL